VVEQLLNHISRQRLCKTTDKILLAVSGGVDSMVMLYLFRQAGFSIGVAHCNFQMRGEASKEDEALVKNACEQYGIQFHLRRFDTVAYAEENSLSIQMAARELRYSFFEELLKEGKYACVATAHHHNDNIETVLLNLIKGTGSEGLTGIAPNKGKVIRPLLFATRQIILEYATLHKIRWREDESNNTDDYQRNFIRHQIIPRLREINPNFENTFYNTLKRLAGANVFANEHIQRFVHNAQRVENDQILIDKDLLKTQYNPGVLLWEIIKDKGFNFDQCEDIVSEHQPGKKFSSGNHELFVDRQHYILREKSLDDAPSLSIEENAKSVTRNNLTLKIDFIGSDNFVLNKSQHVAQLDLDKISYPLTWRTWQSGDAFVPYGLGHSKKISDFLIDLKLPLPQKKAVTVLESDGTIVWVVGHRINDNFKVTGKTERVVVIRLGNKD
jgi:tRNA(Ile)-lysidine synthase